MHAWIRSTFVVALCALMAACGGEADKSGGDEGTSVAMGGMDNDTDIVSPETREAMRKNVESMLGDSMNGSDMGEAMRNLPAAAGETLKRMSADVSRADLEKFLAMRKKIAAAGDDDAAKMRALGADAIAYAMLGGKVAPRIAGYVMRKQQDTLSDDDKANADLYEAIIKATKND